MATQTATPITRAGQDLTALAVAVDAGGSDKWANTGKEFVYVDNQNGATLTVTLTAGPNYAVDGQTPANRTFTISTTHRAIVGPFPTATYNDANGFMTLSWSVTASVKLLVMSCGNSS